MSIRIVGLEAGAERDAAERMATVWKPILGPDMHIVVAVGIKCFGHDLQDIDLLVLGTFGRGLTIKASDGQSATLVNLALAIDVKDHTPPHLRFDSQHVKVLYKHGWEDATEKSFRQAKTLVKYLKENKVDPVPWIESAVWIRNFMGEVPSLVGNAIAGNTSHQDWIDLIFSIRKPRGGGAKACIAFHRNDAIEEVQAAANFLTQSIPVTALDRQRCERITRKLIDDQKYAERLGQQLLVFRGQAGSGKTIHLLRLTSDLYRLGKRVLLLTFNKALVADVRRLFIITGMNNTLDAGVHIQTAHSFFIEACKAWDVWSVHADDDPTKFPVKGYTASKAELLKLLGGQSPETLAVESPTQEHPETFGWDYVLVDEAQDWPDDERDLLFTLYTPNRVVIADGIDQLVRQTVACDWTRGTHKKQVVGLPKALRLGAVLCQFVAAFSEAIGGEWNQDANDELLVGEITIIDGPYTRAAHEAIMQVHAKDGNQPLDALFCTRPDSQLAEKLTSWGCDVWDGTKTSVRDSFPTNTEQHRIVNYQSCRGLEGWTVVCLGLDSHYEFTKTLAMNEQRTELISAEEYSSRRAAASALIPLTRAIKHLVIQLDGRGNLPNVLKELSTQFVDSIHWESSRG